MRRDVSSPREAREGAKPQRRIGIRRAASDLQVLSFLLPRLIPPEIDQRQSNSIVTGRFRVVTGRKQPNSAKSPGSGRFAYRSAGRPVCTARYGCYPSVLKTLSNTMKGTAKHKLPLM
ncbi:hypothetical protein BHE74_00059872 [Ensete ventricosum]|nr:hypothetical protein BHE74_00059872 [Ensete ventricosum]